MNPDWNAGPKTVRGTLAEHHGDCLTRYGGCCDCWLTAYQKEVAETDALKLRLVEAARAERSTRYSERQRILAALVTYLEDGGGTFRKFISIMGMDYTAAYDEGWMGFTNALCDHESRILGKEPEPLI